MSSSSSARVSPARTSAVPARPATSTPRRRRTTRTTSSASGSRRSRRPALRRRRRRARSRTATTSTPGALMGLKAVNGDISGGQKTLQPAIGEGRCSTRRTEPSSWTRTGRRSWTPSTRSSTSRTGKLAVKTVGEVPNVDQTFGGSYSAKTPAPGRTFPPAQEASCRGTARTISSEGRPTSTLGWRSQPHPSTSSRSSACGGSAGASGACMPCATSTSMSRPASGARSSARTARARRRSST